MLLAYHSAAGDAKKCAQQFLAKSFQKLSGNFFFLKVRPLAAKLKLRKKSDENGPCELGLIMYFI